MSSLAQTAYTVREPTGRVVERVHVQANGATVVRDACGRLVRIERERGPSTVTTDRWGRVVAITQHPHRHDGPVLVRDPSGRLLQRIDRSSCGRMERVFDRTGRLVETRQILPTGDIMIRRQ